MNNFIQSLINPIQQKATNYVQDFANSAIGKGVQGAMNPPHSIPTNPITDVFNQTPLGNRVQGALRGFEGDQQYVYNSQHPRIMFGGEMETLPMTTAAFEGIQMPQYGMPRADVSDLEGAMDTIQNTPRSVQAKDSFNTLQDIVERYAPSHVNDTNDQLLGTASRILDAHYGNGASTVIEPLNHNH